MPLEVLRSEICCVDFLNESACFAVKSEITAVVLMCHVVACHADCCFSSGLQGLDLVALMKPFSLLSLVLCTPALCPSLASCLQPSRRILEFG